MESTIANGDLVKLKKMINDGVDVNKGPGRNALSAVHHAIRHYQPDILRFLLEEKKMDPNIEDGYGFSPLFDLCSETDRGVDEKIVLECFRILKDAKANLDIESNNSWRMSALEKAVFDGNFTMTKALIEAGANFKLDTIRIDGKSGNLLHLAITKSRSSNAKNDEEISFKIIKFLIEKMGKDSINEKINGKYSALDIADKKYNNSFINGRETDDSRFFHSIIKYIEEMGGERNELPSIPLQNRVKIDENLDQRDIDVFKKFASTMSIAAHVLNWLIESKKDGWNSDEEVIRMAAYAYKEIDDLMIYTKENYPTEKLSWERFNAIQAMISIERLLDPKIGVHSGDTKSLTDIRCDISNFLTQLNVFSQDE